MWTWITTANPDILLASGSVYPEVAKCRRGFRRAARRLLFRNQGNGTFAQMGEEAGPAINAPHMSRGAAFGDFDNDGDMDVLIMNVDEPPSLLRNDAPAGHNWIKIRLEGTKSNRSAIGARVVVRYGGKVQVQEVTSGCSFSRRTIRGCTSGWARLTTADIEIRWTSGLVEKLARVAAGQLITVKEGSGRVSGRPFGKEQEFTWRQECPIARIGEPRVPDSCVLYHRIYAASKEAGPGGAAAGGCPSGRRPGL